MNAFPAESGNDSDVQIIESKPMDYGPSAASLMDSHRMYAQIPSALATPPQSPTEDGWPPNQAATMPLVTDLLTRNGHVNIPPGFVLCIPCYLCKQPFNDIKTFKEHLTQHAAEIHAWNTAREQLSQEPIQPMFQPFLDPVGQPMGHPAGAYIRPMEVPQQQAPIVSITCPSQPQMPFHMPPIQFPVQRQHHPMAVQSSLEFPGHCPVHQPHQIEFPFHQRLHGSVPLTPQSPLEMMENHFDLQKIRAIPQQHHTPMEFHRNPRFMMQKVPPPVEIQRIALLNQIEARDQHLSKEKPTQLPEKNLKDQLPIEVRLRMPPSMELQRIVLQKPQQPDHSPIEGSNQHFTMEQTPHSPEELLEHQISFQKRQLPELQRIVLQKPQQPDHSPIEGSNQHFTMKQTPHSPEELLEHQISFQKRQLPELQRIVLQKPRQPIQSPIEAKERNFLEEQPQPQSPEKKQFSNQERLSISPPMELQPKPQPPNELLSRPSMRGRFQCEWCGKKLSSRQSMRYHQSRFHLMYDPPTYKIGKNVQKQFKCATCKKRYKRSNFLLMHMKIKHGIHGSSIHGAPSDTIHPVTIESPAEAPPSPERSTSPTTSEKAKQEVWSTKVSNSVAPASYSPAPESAAKYVSAPRQQSEQLESGFVAKPKRVYPMRSPFFNPDLWLDCDAYF